MTNKLIILFIMIVIIYNLVNSKRESPEVIQYIKQNSKTIGNGEFYIYKLNIRGMLAAEHAWLDDKNPETIVIKDFIYQNNIKGELAEYNLRTGNFKIIGNFQILRPKEVKLGDVRTSGEKVQGEVKRSSK